MGLGIAFEGIAAAASLWAETSSFGLLGTLSIGMVSAAATAMRLARSRTGCGEENEAAFMSELIRR